MTKDICTLKIHPKEEHHSSDYSICSPRAAHTIIVPKCHVSQLITMAFLIHCIFHLEWLNMGLRR